MSSFLKNQILKHLTKYAKNLSPEKIKINAFKGEGDVFNLELDENKLTELLELPNWLKIKRAACNKVSIKVQWTLIKKQSIVLMLDDVIVSVEALEIPRTPNKFKDATSQGQNTYGFIDRVIDGMMIKVNMARIFFTAKAFKASMELTRVSLSSKMPNWCDADHLKKTRIKCVSQGFVLLFKEIEWDSTRIEASALKDCQATPVKLITNATKVRLTIKKSLADQSIIESKAEFILIDLFWVLTISQIKAAVLFTESLKGIIQKSNEMNKEAAKIRLESQQSISNCPGRPEIAVNDKATNWSFTNSLNNRQKLVLKYNLKETSYHILVSRVEFHFCEEGDQSSSLSKNSVLNGSVKLLLTNSQVDLYPYHLSSLTREHFPNYKELHRNRELWVNNIYGRQTLSTADDQNILMESVTIVRFNDISMHCVSTAQKTNKCLFISSDIIRHKLPEKTTTFFLDFTDHYWRTGSFQNLPEKTLYCQMNPLNLNLDWATILWLNAFQLNLKHELKSSQYANNFLSSQELSTSQKTPAIHIEAIMPRITITPDKMVTGQLDRPQQIQIQIGTLSIDNVCHTNSDSDLIQQVVQEYQKSSFFGGHAHFLYDLAGPKLNSSINYSDKSGKYKKSSDKSILKICFDPLWIDYEGAKSYNKKPKQCLESLHLTLWITIPTDPKSDIGIMCKLRDRLELRFNHYQLLLLYRIIDSVSSATSLLQEDKSVYSKTIVTAEPSRSIFVVLQIEKTSLWIEWPAPPVIVNSLTECSTPPQLKLINNFEEELLEPSEIQQKNSNLLFEVEPLSFQCSNSPVERKKVANTFVRSRQVSPTNIILDGSPILQPNRRSYTSLITMTKSIPNGKNAPTTNLLTYKSVKNLFSSGKISRRGSQNSLNVSESEQLSIDSDTSDWISEALLNELDIGEDLINDSVNGISIEADGMDSNTSSSVTTCWVNFDISDFKWLIAMGETSWINFGIFGNIVIGESQRAESANQTKTDSNNNDETNYARVLGKIEYPNQAGSSQNSVMIDIRILKDMEQSLLMSTLVSLGEIFEDEIPPSEKYSKTVVPPIFRIHFLSSISFEMIEDRPCNNLSCPSEHPPTLLKMPPGMIINIEGATVVLIEFNQTNNDKVLNGPTLCQRCSQRRAPLSGLNSFVTNPNANTYEHIRHERGLPKNKEFNNAHMKMILQLQQQNKSYQDEIIRLRSEIQNMQKSQNDLRNLIESPSTHFI